MLSWNYIKDFFKSATISKPDGAARQLNPLWDGGTKKYPLYPEKYFHDILTLEQKRMERSGGFFSLMLLDLQKLFQTYTSKDNITQKTAKILFSSTRETDIKGWYECNSTVGVLFTGAGWDVLEPIKEKIKKGLFASFGSDTEKIEISFHSFSQSYIKSELSHIGTNVAPAGRAGSKPLNRIFKRALDISGSLFLLVILLPFFIFIPLLIKLNSTGPVFFRQQRIGFRGKPFTFIKFRSMYVNNADSIHKEFVREFIRGKPNRSNGEKRIYKIKADPRVTPVGKFLRKSSLDELPQFINVLKGEMSLVGPRPPLPYEVEDYGIWHLRRIAETKPGITGLWQVSGRSRTSFDEMVRLDLRYARNCSLWMDIVILLRTPWAVLAGKGAY